MNKIKHDLSRQYKKEYLDDSNEVNSITQGIDKFIDWLDRKGLEITKKINGAKVDKKVKISDN